MFDYHIYARNIAGWSNLGVTLPDDLAVAIDVFKAALAVVVPGEPVFDFKSVTVDNAAAKIDELAGEIVKIPRGPGPVSEAKSRIVDHTARRVVSLAADAVPSMIEQLTPEFTRHAEAYVKAARRLPDPLGNETLVSGGPGVVKAFAEAQSAAAELDKFADWVSSCSGVPGLGGGIEPVLRVLHPTTYDELRVLDEAAERSGWDATDAERAVNGVYLAAAREGIEFRINPPRELREIRQSLT
ncbi:hypothetical protein ACXPWS_09160 [Mycobacterium sp. BMJ-28]